MALEIGQGMAPARRIAEGDCGRGFRRFFQRQRGQRRPAASALMDIQQAFPI